MPLGSNVLTILTLDSLILHKAFRFLAIPSHLPTLSERIIHKKNEIINIQSLVFSCRKCVVFTYEHRCRLQGFDKFVMLAN